MSERIAFIGGGNMANAIIGGLIQQGYSGPQIDVVEPSEDARKSLNNVLENKKADKVLDLMDAVIKKDEE